MKKCRECGESKELKEYYKHKQMGDGHLNKCKDCVKKRVHAYWDDGRGKVVDKKRQKTPARKKWQREYSAKMRKKNRKKIACRGKFWRAYKRGSIKKQPCQWCGSEEKVEAHHYDYDRPYDIAWLCPLHHKSWHRANAIRVKQLQNLNGHNNNSTTT